MFGWLSMLIGTGVWAKEKIENKKYDMDVRNSSNVDRFGSDAWKYRNLHISRRISQMASATNQIPYSNEELQYIRNHVMNGGEGCNFGSDVLMKYYRETGEYLWYGKKPANSK